MNAPFPSPSRSKLIGLAMLVAVFVAGGLGGAAFSRVLEAGEPARAAAGNCERGGPGGGRGRGGPSTLLLQQVDLTADQRARIEAIMERGHQRIDAFWDTDGKRLRGIVDSTRAEIRAQLTPAQRAEYDRLVAEHRARKRAQRGDSSRAEK